MRLIIAGGRDYCLTDADMAWLDAIHEAHDIAMVLSGGADGADRGGSIWAASHGIEVRYYLPEWGQRGRAAGPIRNRQMAENADAVALFPGGKGTTSMRREAERHGLIIFSQAHRSGT